MKLINNEQTSDYFKHVQKAAIQGAVVGGAVSLGLRSFIKYRSPTFFKRAGGYQLGLIYGAPPAFCAMTNMERMSVSYEQAKVDQKKEAKAQKQSWPEFFNEYKYPTIVTGWAASMVGSFWMVNRNPFMTKAQKIVQARVYAQGLTVLMLLASVAFTVSSQDTEKNTRQKREQFSRSWEQNIDFVKAANGSSKSQ